MIFYSSTALFFSAIAGLFLLKMPRTETKSLSPNDQLFSCSLLSDHFEMRLKYFLFCFSLFLFATATQAQEHFLLSVDRNDIMIGDPVKLKIDLQLPLNAEIIGLAPYLSMATLAPVANAPIPGQLSPAPAKAASADFEIRDLGHWTTLPDSNQMLPGKLLTWDTLTSGNTTIFTNTLEIIPWDAGIIRFMPMMLGYRLNGEEQIISSNDIELKVNAPQAPATVNPQDSLSLAPIKTIKQEPFQLEDLIPFLGLLLVVAFLLVLLWSFLRERKTVIPPPAPTRWIPIEELAKAQLNQLRGKQLWQQGQVKAYQSELTHIVREYLENRYHIQALEAPTSEILRQMQPLQFSDEHKKQLQEMLQMADMVKFAKAEPEVTVHDREMEKALDFVQKTRFTALSDEAEEGWVEVSVESDPESVIYQLVQDTQVRKRVTETPNDFIKFEEADFGRRLAASLLDIVVVLGLLGALFFALSNIPLMMDPQIFFYLAIGFVVLVLITVWIYFVEMEVRGGATWGKRLLSLQTMNATQGNISRVEGVIRLAIKTLGLALLPLFIIYTLIKKSRVLLQDSLTDTRVYYVKK